MLLVAVIVAFEVVLNRPSTREGKGWRSALAILMMAVLHHRRSYLGRQTPGAPLQAPVQVCFDWLAS